MGTVHEKRSARQTSWWLEYPSGLHACEKCEDENAKQRKETTLRSKKNDQMTRYQNGPPQRSSAETVAVWNGLTFSNCKGGIEGRRLSLHEAFAPWKSARLFKSWSSSWSSLPASWSPWWEAVVPWRITKHGSRFFFYHETSLKVGKN